jgi:glycosyltransferase involved in cell wall biosynthesis
MGLFLKNPIIYCYNMRQMKRNISYILPIYNEEGNIDLFYKELCAALKPSSDKYNYELIFINDGSKDTSLEKLAALAKKDKRVALLNFSRNFGHQAAITAGLDYADGDAVIIMDTDLQDPPEVSLQLIEKWQEGYDVVYAQRKSRQDGLFKRISANLYYRVLSSTADIVIPRNTGDFRLMDHRVVVELRKFREHNRYMRGLVSYLGFKQVALPFDRQARHAGESGYPFKKMVQFATDGILSFSTTPIKFMNNLGLAVALLSFLAFIAVGVVKLLDPSKLVPGWAFIIMSIFFIGGVQLIMMGVLGSYIGRTYLEVQGRPLYIIESLTNKKRLP